MRRIAIINQKGGVGKTTTAVNLGAALARLGRRVVVIDMDPQANASMNLGAELAPGEPSTYTLLTGNGRVADTLHGTSTPGLSLLPSHLDLSGAELELASAIGRESILKDALDDWERDEIERTGRPPADVVLIDNPPSLGLLSVNGLVASNEVLIAVQTEFFALQGLGKLVEIVQLLRRRMNPDLEITGVLACMYDGRLRLAREVLSELKTHFPDQIFTRPIAQNVKLAETPSFSRTIFEYAPESRGAADYLAVAREFLDREGVERDDDLRAVEAPVAAEPEAKSAPRSAPEPEPEPQPQPLDSFELVPQAAPDDEAPEPGGPEPEPVIAAAEPVIAAAGPAIAAGGPAPSFGAGLEESMLAVQLAPEPAPSPAPEPEAESLPEPKAEAAGVETDVAPGPRAAEPLAHRGEERRQVPSRRGPRAGESA